MDTDSKNSLPSGLTLDPIENAVVAAVKQYMQMLEQGSAPDIAEYCEQHGPIASQLRPALEGLALVHRPASDQAKVTNDTLGGPSGTTERDLPGKPIGDFQIVGELGRGGMGVVYEAIQLSLNRRVALKVLPFASGLDKIRLQRFRNEAHAAAGLHHTNIVPVYAVGSERGVHYYAMQLIEGHTLAELIERMRASQVATSTSGSSVVTSAASTDPKANSKVHGGSARKLDETFRQASSTLLKSHESPNHYFESVVEMTIQAAQALEHAHQYGIIHRDIKPGNLLLDQTGKIWVTDFGLAQIQHMDGQLTRSGDHIGTLRYMSPEQAAGDRDVLDHRCDIYSLGVTLYELLTLRPAIVGENYRQMLNQVAEQEPVAPRHVNPAIPQDLDTIVRKAISKEPTQRYATARALADDLQRWLGNKPIAAKPPTIWQRIAKWRKRNSLLVNMAGVLLFFMSVGLLATTLLVLKQQSATKLALKNEIEQRNIAEQNFQQARQAVDTFSQLSESELAFRPEVQTLRRKMLETSLEFYRSFLAQHQDDVALSYELKAVSDKAENILQELKLIQESNLYTLLEDPRVLTDLGVDENQSQQIRQFLGEYYDDPTDSLDFGDLQYAAINVSSIARTKLFVESISSLLSTEQRQRLRQISYQLQLPFTFTSDEVVELLGISSAQRILINRIIMDHRPDKHHKEARGPQPPKFGPGPRPMEPRPMEPRPMEPGEGPRDRRGARDPENSRDPDDRRQEGARPRGFGFAGPGDPKMFDIRRQTVEEILKAALNSEQRKKWAELIGRPIHAVEPGFMRAPL